MRLGGTTGLFDRAAHRLEGWFCTMLALGVRRDQPTRVARAIRFCNASALIGFSIMILWAAAEERAGARANLFWELGLALGFACCLLANRLRYHRVGRFGLLLVADFAVLAAAVLFPEGSRGSLPFVAMVGLPLLLFAPSEPVLLGIGTCLVVVLFALCESGAIAGWFGIEPRVAPSWYFIANAASAFALSFLIPLSFYTASLRAEAELERSGREKLERLIDSSIIGVARGRLTGPILEANDAFLKVVGYSRRDLREGRVDLKVLTAPEYAEATRSAFAVLKERGASPVYEKEYVRKDGSRVPVLVGMSLLDRQLGEVVGFVLDISAQKELEHQREVLREKEEAVRLRDLFNSVASHELRTPLSVLILQVQRAAQWLAKAAPDEALRHLLLCEVSAKKLAALVDELFDLASAARGTIELSARTMDLVEAAHAVVRGLDAGGACRPGQISVQGRSPVAGCWDPVRIDQVITNLVTNAVKYGRDQPIEVRVSGARDRARLEVADHGIGIEANMLDRIFDPFQRAMSGKEIRGLGLGLFVVRSIVEAHGGTVSVESECGAGSRFIVELPAVVCDR